MRRQKRNYGAWKVVAGCCCIQGGVLGLIVNCRGLFFEPVCAELGLGLGAFTAYGLFYGIACCTAIPIAARAIEKIDIRAVLATSALFMAILQGLFGTFVHLWQWYIAAAMQGMASAFLFSLTTPLLINNWFDKKRGVVLGITGASSGIVGALMNPTGAMVIQRFGWRAGYYFFGIVFFLMTVPAALFLIRLYPEEEDQRRRGGQKGPAGFEWHTAEAIKRPDFILLIIIAGIANLLTCYSQMLGSYGADIGLEPETSAILVSLAMTGNVVIKLLLGALNDWINAVAAVRRIYPASLRRAGGLFVYRGISAWNGNGHYYRSYSASCQQILWQ